MGKLIELPCYDIKVALNDKGGSMITSNLHDPDLDCDFNIAMDAIESIVMAHASAGIDVESPAYIEGIETAVNACANNF